MFAKSKPACQFATTIAALLALVVFWYMANIILILFGGLLWAIFLNKTTKILQKYVPWNYPLALTVVFLGVLSIFTLIGLLAAPQIAVQVGEFSSQITRSWEEFYTYVDQFADQWIQLRQTIDWGKQLEELPNVLLKATGWVTAAGGGLLTAFVAIYFGTLVAYDPQPYKAGVLALIPESRKKQIKDTLNILKNSLWRWLLGRFASMTAVGILTWIGLMFLGMPLPFLLALLAGLLSFIPNIGIIIATSLALLLAFPLGWMMMLWVIVLYVVVQMIEGNLIMPFIEQRLMSLPAGLIIVGQIVFGYLFGFLGIMFATPLLVAVIVLVRKLYVEELQ